MTKRLKLMLLRLAQKATTIIDNAVQDRHTVTKDSQTHDATVAFTASATGTAGM